MDVLDHHDCVVDHEADGDRESSHGHQVDRLAPEPQEKERRHCRDWQRRRRHGGDTPVAQEEEEDDDGKKAADDHRVAHAGNRLGDELREVVHLRHAEPGGQRVREIGERLLDTGLHVEHVGADLLRQVDHGGVAPVGRDERSAVRRAHHDVADI
jgi:hypothetical protein